MATVQDALAGLLSALGYNQMAREVRTEKRRVYLRRYANFIVKETRKQHGADKARQIKARFDKLEQMGEL